MPAETAGQPPVALEDLVDERTRELIRGRRFGKTHRRGWIVRRALARRRRASGSCSRSRSPRCCSAATGRRATRSAAWVEFVGFLVTLPLWLVLARLLGLYDATRSTPTTRRSTTRRGVPARHGRRLAADRARLADEAADPYMPKLLLFWGSAIVLVSLARAVARSRVRRTDAYVQNTVIVGAGDVAQLLGSKILRHPEYGINLLGFVDKLPRDAARRHRRPDRARRRRAAAADRRRARRRARDRRLRGPGPGHGCSTTCDRSARTRRADRRRAAPLRHRRPGRRLPRDRGVPARRPAARTAAVVVADAEADARPRRQRDRPRAAVAALRCSSRSGSSSTRRGRCSTGTSASAAAASGSTCSSSARCGRSSAAATATAASRRSRRSPT